MLIPSFKIKLLVTALAQLTVSVEIVIAVGDQLFLGMQDFDFAQIQSNFSKSD